MVCRPIHKHFGGDDITERQEHLHQLSIPKLLREVVDEQVATLWSCTRKTQGETEKERRPGEKTETKDKGQTGRERDEEGGERGKVDRGRRRIENTKS